MSPEQNPNMTPPTSETDIPVAEAPEVAVPTPASPEVPVEAPVASEEVATKAAPDLIGMPPGYEPKPAEAPAEPVVDENAQAIAQARIIQGQAMMNRMTPPAPGTPVETFVPPAAAEPTPSAEVAPAAPAEATPVAPQPAEFSTEAAVEAASRVSEASTETPEVPQQ